MFDYVAWLSYVVLMVENMFFLIVVWLWFGLCCLNEFNSLFVLVVVVNVVCFKWLLDNEVNICMMVVLSFVAEFTRMDI